MTVGMGTIQIQEICLAKLVQQIVLNALEVMLINVLLALPHTTYKIILVYKLALVDLILQQ